MASAKALQNNINQWLQKTASNLHHMQNMLLLKGGRRQLIKIETALKNNYAFNNAAVKFCGTFTCPAWKFHGIKNRRHWF